MPNVVESPQRMEHYTKLMVHAFERSVLEYLKQSLEPKGYRVANYFDDILGPERGKELAALFEQAMKENSNACLTGGALHGVIRMTGFGRRAVVPDFVVYKVSTEQTPEPHPAYAVLIELTTRTIEVHDESLWHNLHASAARWELIGEKTGFSGNNANVTIKKCFESEEAEKTNCCSL